MRSKELFHILTPRAKFSLLAAIFFVFSPVSLLAVSGGQADANAYLRSAIRCCRIGHCMNFASALAMTFCS